MAAVIRIKRSTAGAAPTSLAEGELAYAELAGAGTAGVLYVGASGDEVRAIAGLGQVAPLASPALTGVPTAPTASAATDTTQIATTAYVKSQAYIVGTGVDAGTYTKVTVSSAGLVTAGGTLTASDVPTLTAAKISDFDTQVRTSRLDQMAAPTGNLSVNNQRITSVAAPSDAQDATNKQWVEALFNGSDNKGSVRVATTVNVDLALAPDTVDGVALAANDLVLVHKQTDPIENGIYKVSVLGTGADGVWVRADNADISAEVTSGLFVFVSEGTAYGGNGYTLTTPDPIVLDTDPLTFTQTSATGQIIEGPGIGKTGNEIYVKLGTSGTPAGRAYTAGSIVYAATTSALGSVALTGIVIGQGASIPIAYNSGEPNGLVKYASSGSIGNSTITDDGTTVTANGLLSVSTTKVGIGIAAAYASSILHVNNDSGAATFERLIQGRSAANNSFGIGVGGDDTYISAASGGAILLATGSDLGVTGTSVPTNVRFTVSASASTLTGNGASTIATNSGALTLAPASGSNLDVTMTGVGYVNITASGADRSLESTSSGLKTGHNYGTVCTNTSTSDTASISKHGIYVNSVGLWDGGSNPNYAIYIAGASGGDTNWAIYNNTAADVYLGTGNTLIGAAGTPTADLSFGGAATINTLAGALTLAPATYTQLLAAGASGFPALGTVGNTFNILRTDGAVGLLFSYDTVTGDSAIQSGRTDGVFAYNLILQPGGGNVGIGTTAPQALLHISGATSPGVMISDTDAGADVKNYEFYAESGKAYIRRLTDAFSGYDPTITFDSGKVGIGTTSPGATLDVGGITGWGGSNTGLTASFSGVNSPLNGGGNLRVVGTTTHAIDTGASITIGGMYNGTANQIDFAEISGRKENDTINNVNGYLALATRDNALGQQEWVRITSAGNVGIGTTLPLSALHARIPVRTTAYDAGDWTTWGDVHVVNPVTSVQNGMATGISFLQRNVNDNNGSAGIAAIRGSADYEQSLAFIVRPGNAVSTEIVRITSSGKVGIGTTTPIGKLDVLDGILYLTNSNVSHGMTAYYPTQALGGLQALHATNGGISLVGATDADSTALHLRAYVGSSGTLTAPAISVEAYKKAAAGDGIQDISATEIYFQIKDVAFNMLGNGNVGIGNIAPAASLHVGAAPTGNAASVCDVFVKSSLNTEGALRGVDATGNYVCQIYCDSSYGHLDTSYLAGSPTMGLKFGVTAAGVNATAMTILSTGNVGIGTASPGSYDGESRNLVIFSTTTPGLTIATSTTTSRCAIRFADGITGNETYRGGIEYDHGTGSGGTADSMHFRTAAAIRMSINGDGNVGIGTTSPGAQLHVVSDGLGVTQSNTAGAALATAGTAALNAQQISPAIRWRAYGWDTVAAASKSVDFRQYVLPVQAAGDPTARLITEVSRAGAAYSTVCAWDSAGVLTDGTIDGGTF